MTLTAQLARTDVARARQRARDVLFLVYRDGLGAIFGSAYAAPAQRMLAHGLDVRLLTLSPVGEWIRPALRRRWKQVRQSAGESLRGRLHRIPSPPSRHRRAWDESRLLTAWLKRRYGRRRTEPLILHCGASEAAVLALEARERLPYVRVVFQCWGPSAAEYLAWKRNTGSGAEGDLERAAERLDAQQRRATRESDAMVSISAAMTRWAVDEYDADVEKIIEVPCFVDTERFARDADQRMAIRRELGIGERFTVVYTGSLLDWQFPDGCLHVLRGVRSRIPDAHFLAVTTNPEAMRQRLAAGGYPLEAATILRVPFADVPRYISAGDVGILGRNLGEPWALVNAVSSPIKFGEYTSCGVPVILSEGVGDFSQATRERDLGVVIPHSADAERTGALVSAFVARFDADRQGYRERCRSFAMEELAIDRHIPRLVSLYEQM